VLLFRLGAYEGLVIAGVFALVFIGPAVAAGVVAWVRRRRRRPG
jgi:hypothetical protein